MVKIFYHNDPDGCCSAFWVRKYLEDNEISFNDEDFIEMNYDKVFPFEKVENGELVYMVDFSLDPEDMIKLNNICNFIWIDHHKTAIDKMNKFDDSGSSIKGLRFDGIAGCLLTWFYLLNNDEKTKLKEVSLLDMDKYSPLFTKYIHLWDTWKWKEETDIASDVEAFITALNCSNCHPLSYMWDMLNDNNKYVKKLVEKGKSCIEYRDGYAEGMCEQCGSVVEFEGYKCFVCNFGHVSSEWFKSVDESSYDIMMPFYYNAQTKLFCFSLYTTKDIDVSKIAVKYGGGGHFKAAGFQCKELPF